MDWIDEGPGHWETLPLCGVGAVKSVRGKTERQLLSVYLGRGVIRFSEVDEKRTNPTSEDLTQYQAVDPGDFVLNNQQAWRGSVGVSSLAGIVSPAYLVLSLQPRIDPRFGDYLFRSSVMVAQYLVCSRGVGTIQRNLYWPALKRVRLLAPPVAEQVAIVRFLDHADRRIQRYIRAKERLIELLEEQKQAIIHQAITGQIDVRTGQPYPAYKNSGVEWLRKVPAHWEVRRLKTLAEMQSGDAITAISIEETGEYPVFGGNGIRGYSSHYTHEGAFALIGRQGALCGNIHLAQGRFWASEHAVVATLRSRHNLEWFSALLKVMDLNQYSIAAAQPGLSVDRVLNLWAPVPRPDEQRHISQLVTARNRDMRNAVVATRGQVDLLQEYRTRLIADVVTGKLNVREAAASLPEIDPLTADNPTDNPETQAPTQGDVSNPAGHSHP